MSSESDSEVFFDAEDTTPVRTTKIKDKGLKSDDRPIDNTSCDSQDPSSLVVVSTTDNEIKFPVIQVSNEYFKEAERKAKENEKRRRKVEEQRNRMLMDDEEILQVPSEQSSLASSVDGIFPSVNSNINNVVSGKSSEESKSTISLGKLGTILGEKASMSSDIYPYAKESDTVSTDSKYSVSASGIISDIDSANFSKRAMKGPEPDVVASTKGERMELVCPAVPPRKKRRNKTHTHNTQASALTPSDDIPKSFGDGNTDVHIPPSPDPIENLSKEFEYSLDLQSATRGQYVVKPEDREQDRAEGPGSHACSEKMDCGANGDSLSRTQPSPASSRKGSLKKDGQDGQYFVRTKTDSGRTLTDQEILASVKVLNLDTGEQIPLNLAEEHLPKCLNPLSLHIMRLTSEYVSNTALDKERESDEESTGSRRTDILDRNSVWTKTREITRLFGKNIGNSVNKLKTAGKAVADKVHHTRHNEDISEDELPPDSRSTIEIKMSSKLKSVDKGRKEGSEFEKIKVVQELSGEHTGAIWTMKFSCCGRLLATAGQDHCLRIWILKDSFKYFDDMRQKFSAAEGKTSPTPSEENSSPTGTLEPTKSCDVEQGEGDINENSDGPFISQPFCRYKAHTAEILDVSWSKNYFILSSSMDKTVRLWHISRQECLCCFQHIDFVTAIAFHPRDDSYFLSGSLDGKLRLWNIPDKKVTLWNELDGQTKLITAVNFCRNGKMAVVGSYDGRCIFYNTDQLKYYTQIHVRSSRGKNKGRKISGIEAMPGEDKLLVTSNDSRIRLYDLRDLSLSCKYKGYVNLSSQIKATFSHDGKYIMSGSENQFIYIWKTFHDYAKFSRRDRNDYWERIKAHNAVVTSAIFAPNPSLILKQLENEQEDENGHALKNMEFSNCYVMVSADFSGTIKVFLHRSRNGMPS